MPRYHFHARGPTDFVPDLKGEVLPDREAANNYTHQFAREIRDGSVVSDYWVGWCVEITDELGIGLPP
jgi:hypothetical protein